MTSHVYAAVIAGGSSAIVTVESSFVQGFAGLSVVGNIGELCREGKERAKASLEKAGFILPPRKIVINMSPAEWRKDGNQFDLPMAVSLVSLLNNYENSITFRDYLFCCELGLGGEMRPVAGVVPFALAAIGFGLKGMVVAIENLNDLLTLKTLLQSQWRDFEVFGFGNFCEVIKWLQTGSYCMPELVHESPFDLSPGEKYSFSQMIMSEQMEKVTAVIGAGMHHALLRGAPGTGKTMLARRLCTILPKMGADEHLEALKIHSLSSSTLAKDLLLGIPPFRMPHHQASSAAVLGSIEEPGELSLAHGGVLFLDELPEFRRDVLESLREPLETGSVHISRAQAKLTRSAKALIIAACNECPCGWFGSQIKECRCSLTLIQRYLSRLSGPLINRIDIHFKMPEINLQNSTVILKSDEDNDNLHAKLLSEVFTAREFSISRNRKYGVLYNRDLPSQFLLKICGLNNDKFHHYLKEIKLNIGNRRTVVRCMRIARTLADLEERESINALDLKQAWQWQIEGYSEEQGYQHLGLG